MKEAMEFVTELVSKKEPWKFVLKKRRYALTFEFIFTVTHKLIHSSINPSINTKIGARKWT